MSYTLSVGSDGSATTAQVAWSVNGQTYKFRSDNNFISWITTIFDVADSLNIIGGLDLLLTDQIPPVQGGAGNIFAKYDAGVSVAGNARGVGAVDLQQARSLATQVASGANSVIAGGSENTASFPFATIGGGVTNTASDSFSVVAGGRLNTASGYNATVCGGASNTASNYYATVGGGTQNTASGDNATVGGGYSNTASNSSATVGGGNSNTASNISATVGGGYQNTASLDFGVCAGGRINNCNGLSATIGGGEDNETTGIASCIPGGYRALADRYGMVANASGQFSSRGDAQAVSFVMRNTTSGATTANLKLDGSTENLTIPSGKLLSGIINISGIDSTGAEVLNYLKQFAIKNVAGTTTLVHQAVIGTNHRDNPALDAVISADNVNDCLQVACTGRAGLNFRWVAVVTGLEIAYG